MLAYLVFASSSNREGVISSHCLPILCAYQVTSVLGYHSSFDYRHIVMDFYIDEFHLRVSVSSRSDRCHQFPGFRN